MRDIDYATYTLSRVHSLQLGLELFNDHYTCNPSLLLTSLQHTSQELIQRHFSLSALPVLCLYEYTAHYLAHSTSHTVLARAYKLQAMTQLSLYSEAIKLLRELIIGARLPQLFSESDYGADIHNTTLTFNDTLLLNHSKNVRVLSLVVDKVISPSLKESYTIPSYAEIILAQSQLMIQLASTCSEIPSEPILAQNYSEKSDPSSEVTSLSSRTTTQRRSTRNRTLSNDINSASQVKLILLECAEKILYTLLEECEQTIPRKSCSSMCKVTLLFL